MRKKQLVPTKENAAFSTDTVGGSGRVTPGAVFSEFSIQHQFGSGHFWTRVRLYDGVDRIDFQTRILNNEEFARYRVLFPTSIQNGVVTGEIPFGAIERPTELELPAQNWTDYSNGERGVALLNRGLPANNVASDTLILSLMRSSKIIQYAFHGGFEPGVGSDTGLELGKLLTFDYSLLPHEGDWKKARVYKAGWEFNHPLIARKLPVHEGTLPKAWGLFGVSQPNVVVSAMKTGPDGSTILRVYEAAGQASNGVRINWNATVRSANEANLIEDSLSELSPQNNTLQFDLGPFEIRTFRVQLAAGSKQ
jgi:alpha-mannosidase